MVLLSALAAFSAISFQGGTLTLAGKVVQITYPPTPVRQIPEEVKNWDGFQGLAPSQREWPTPFTEAGDWSAIQARIGNLGTPTKGGPEWKTKIFILTQSDVLIGGSGTPLQQIRNRLDQKQIDTVLRALARTPSYVRAATDGAVNASLDVSVEQDPLVLSSGGLSLDEYVRARVNQGRFDAEDKAFRGPYSTVLVLTVEQIQLALSRSADGYGLEEIVADSIADQAFSPRWTNLDIPMLARGGGAGGFVPQIQTLFPNEIWSILQGSDDIPYDSLVKLYELAQKAHQPNEQYVQFPWRAAPVSANVEVSIATDDQRGTVLKYGERSPARFGGFALPYRSIDLSKTPYLTFWAKSNSKDAIAIRVNDGTTKGGLGWLQPLSIPSNGTWTQVTVNLAKRTRDFAKGIYIVPLPSRDRQQIGEIAFFLDDFQLTDEGQPNQPDQLPDPEIFERALAAKNLSASELVKDTSDIVKLNGLISHEGPYATSDEPALVELTKQVNVRVSGEATKRLAELGTPTAKAEVLRLITASPFEHVKQVAAIEVGRFRDPKSAGILSRLFASKSWQTRLAGAQALTMLPGDEAAVISMTFLQETDPQVRLVVTKGANAQNNVVVKRLLWSTVNDPSDAVRSESAWKLISSGRTKDAAEGYKAIRDDSIGVRMSLLGRFEASPNEAHRPAIRLAIADISPWVRAKALRTLAKQPGEVSNEEVANTFDDKFPVVQMALLDLAKSKGLNLPASAVASLKSSIDPRVVERAKDLLP